MNGPVKGPLRDKNSKRAICMPEETRQLSDKNSLFFFLSQKEYKLGRQKMFRYFFLYFPFSLSLRRHANCQSVSKTPTGEREGWRPGLRFQGVCRPDGQRGSLQSFSSIISLVHSLSLIVRVGRGKRERRRFYLFIHFFFTREEGYSLSTHAQFKKRDADWSRRSIFG